MIAGSGGSRRSPLQSVSAVIWGMYKTSHTSLDIGEGRFEGLAERMAASLTTGLTVEITSNGAAFTVMFTCTGGSTVQIAGSWRQKRTPKVPYTSLQKLNSDLVWHAFDYGLQLACGQGTRTHDSIPTATTALFSHLVSVYTANMPRPSLQVCERVKLGVSQA